MDFRAWVIAQGKENYEKALQDPQVIGDMVEPEENTSAEFVLYAASRALDHLGSEAWFNYRDSQPAGPEWPSGEPWEEAGDDLKTRFPRVWAKFGW